MDWSDDIRTGFVEMRNIYNDPVFAHFTAIQSVEPLADSIYSNELRSLVMVDGRQILVRDQADQIMSRIVSEVNAAGGDD